MRDKERRTRSQLLDAAAAVLAARPGASMAEIAEQARVGRATLYRYFASRDALIRALALESMAEIDRVTAPIGEQSTSARHALQLIFDAIVPIGERYHFLMSQPYDEASEVEREYDRQAAELGELIEMAKDEGSIAREVPTAWVAALFDALIYTAWFTVHEGSIASRDAAALAFRSLLDGLSPDKGTSS